MDTGRRDTLRHLVPLLDLLSIGTQEFGGYMSYSSEVSELKENFEKLRQDAHEAEEDFKMDIEGRGPILDEDESFENKESITDKMIEGFKF